jgi:hypothetical protein
LWDTLARIVHRIRIIASGYHPPGSTGTYIGETMRDAVQELDRLFQEQVNPRNGIAPFGYQLRVFLVTDSQEKVSFWHREAAKNAWVQVAEDLSELKEKLGDDLVLEQLYCSDDPMGPTPAGVPHFTTICPPGADHCNVTTYPTLFRTSFNAAVTERHEIRSLYVCTDAPLPPGHLKLQLNGAFLCSATGDAPPFRSDNPGTWIDLNGKVPVELSLAADGETGLEVRYSLRPDQAGQWIRLPFTLAVPTKELAILVREVFPGGVESRIDMVATLSLSFEPDAPAELSTVSFSERLVRLDFFYEPPRIQIDVTREPNSPGTGTLEVEMNQPALDQAPSPGGIPEILVDYNGADVQIQGLDDEGRVAVPALLLHLPLQVLRPVEVPRADRRVSIVVRAGSLVTSDTLHVADVTVEPMTSSVDLRPYVSGGTSLQFDLPVQIACSDSITLSAELSQLQLPAGMQVRLAEPSAKFTCPSVGASWPIRLRVDFPNGADSLRELNRTATDFQLQFRAKTTDPELFVTLPPEPVRVDLQYLERLIEIRITPVGGPETVVKPGDLVAFVEALCSPDTPESARAVEIMLDKGLLAIDATEGVQASGSGRYVVRSSPSTGADEGRYEIRVAPAVWDCPLVVGSQKTALQVCCLGAVSSCIVVPGEEARSLTFKVESRPPIPFEQTGNGQGLRASGGLAAKVTYQLASAPSADIDLRVLIRPEEGSLWEREYFVVTETEEVENRRVFSIETKKAPYGASGVLEFVAVDTACGLPVEAPGPVKFRIETVWPRVFWVGMLVFVGLTLAAVAGFVVYTKLESQTLFDTLAYLWEFERWTLLAGGGLVAIAILIAVVFLAVR